MTPEDAEDWMRFMVETKDDPLHPDLVAYYEEGGEGVLARVLRHPLVYQVPFHHPGMANEAYKAKREALAAAETAGDIDSYLFLHERPWRLHALTQVLAWDFDTFQREGVFVSRQAADQALAEAITNVWIDSENLWQNAEEWERILHGIGAAKSQRMAMDEDDRDRFEALPDTVTVWRGAQLGLNEFGFSWTLNRETARWFATRLRDRSSNEPVLVTGTVAKDAIVGVLMGRGEEEVVPLPGSVKIVSVEPVTGPTIHPGRSQGSGE